MIKRIFVFLMFLSFSKLIAEGLEFMEYGRLSPEINKFSEISDSFTKSNPVIWAKKSLGKWNIISYNTETKKTNTPFSIDFQCVGFWNPLIKKSIVQISCIQDEIPNLEYLKFYEVILNEQNETYTFETCDSVTFQNDRWISNRSHFISSFYMTANNGQSTSLLLDSDNIPIIDFSPELIIGYGDGVIITSRYEESGFEGISIWDENGGLLYQDTDFPLGKPIAEKWSKSYQQAIYESYFLYPYLFINLGAFWGQNSSICLLVVDLDTGSIYRSPDGYQLLSVFE